MDDLPIIPTSCDGCGVCCLGIGSPVVLYASRPHYGAVHPFRPPDLPRELADEINHHFSGLLRGQEPQDCCLWFDPVSRRCRHHEYRPQVCRDYEIAGRECLRERREAIRAGDPFPLRGPSRSMYQADHAAHASANEELSSRSAGTGPDQVS